MSLRAAGLLEVLGQFASGQWPAVVVALTFMAALGDDIGLSLIHI